MMIVLRILCLGLLSYRASACTAKNPKVNAFNRLLGNIMQEPWQGTDQEVSTGDQLACSFEQAGCCWNNRMDGQLGWVWLSGTPDVGKIKRNFQTTNLPQGRFLGVASEGGTKLGFRSAELYSCSIRCTQGPITVNLNHWQTKDITLKVCQEDTPQGPPTDCRQLSKTSGEIESVQLPGGQHKRIVIIAEGFTVTKGSVAAIDDITTQFTPCGQAEPTKAPGGECQKVSCNFESGNPCSYSNAQTAGGNKQWQVAAAPYMNPLTGVPTASEGNSFAAAYLNSGDSAALTSDVLLPRDSIVRFDSYRATEDIELKACCGSTSNCPYTSSNRVQVSDYKAWKSNTVTCPSGTSKIFFEAKNNGKNQGACALDNIHLLFPGSNQPAC